VFCDQLRFLFPKNVAKVYLDYLDTFEATLDMVQIRRDDNRVLIAAKIKAMNHSLNHLFRFNDLRHSMPAGGMEEGILLKVLYGHIIIIRRNSHG
jgi:hypothetical protein